MSTFEQIQTRKQDSQDVDAAGRTRVSQLTTQIDIKQIHDSQPLLVDTESSGTGGINYTLSESATTLSINGGGFAIAQTKQRMNYQSGKSQLIFMTFNGFQTQELTVKRIGYFSSNTVSPFDLSLDGVFLESFKDALAEGIFINVYKSGVQKSRVEQANWNIDTLDGSGYLQSSGNWAQNQVLVIDFLWLGANRVRFGLKIGAEIIYFHQESYDNDSAGVYMKSPNQPLRWEIKAVASGGTASFNYICASVNSEGSINKIGKILSANAGTNDIQFNTAGQTYAGIGIRLKSDRIDSFIDILSFDYLAETNDRALWEVRINPTVTGTFNYSDVTDSSVQISVGNQTGGAAPTVSGGVVIDSGYVGASDSINASIDSAIRLGYLQSSGALQISGVSDEIVVCITPINAGLDAFLAYTWKELT